MALYTGLQMKTPLAGLLALSAYLPHAPAWLSQAKQPKEGLPVSLHHGTMDPVVPVTAGQTTHDALRAAGYEATWDDYPAEHSITFEEIQNIRRWLLKYLG